MPIFFVFQGDTYHVERTGGYVWSPKKNEKGHANAGYTTMTKIRKGDFILHCRDRKILSISITREDCRSADQPQELIDAAPSWDKDGYRVDTDYFDFDNPVNITDYRKWLADHHIHGSAFTVAGKGKEQYMCQLADEHAIFLLDIAIERQNQENVLTHLRDALSEVVRGKESEYELHEKEKINSLVENIPNNIIPKWEATREPQEVTTSSQTGRQIPKRNPQHAADALAHAGFACEYDQQHKTFIRKNGKPYTEPHHLIPLSKYQDFLYSVDIMQNIVSLCSHCHNLLHYGRFEDKKPILEKLFNEREQALKECGIEIKLEQLESYYQ